MNKQEENFEILLLVAKQLYIQPPLSDVRLSHFCLSHFLVAEQLLCESCLFLFGINISAPLHSLHLVPFSKQRIGYSYLN